MNELEQILLNIVDEEQWTIRSVIAQEALRRKPNIELFFKELDRLGCANWMIKSLMEYRDTYYFFNEHYREISDTLLANNDEEWFFFQWNDLPRSIVWCAVEKIVREMACNDLGLDI